MNDSVENSVATGNERQLLIATTGGHLYLLESDMGKMELKEVAHRKVNN